MIIVYIISSITMLGAIIVGIRFTIQVKKLNVLSGANRSKQDIVKERREEFGASNQGTSLENAPIHIIPYDELGITE